MERQRPTPTSRDLFPFAAARPVQKDLLADALRVLSSRGHLVAHAPTGVGKTAAALTAALQVALEADKKVLFLTARQSQHRIAVETLRAMADGLPSLRVVDAISKQSMCLYNNAFRFYGAFHEFCNFMVRTRSCRYFYRDNTAMVEALEERPLHAQEVVALGREEGACPHRAAMQASERAHVVVGDYNYLFSDLTERILRHLGCSLEDIILVVDEAHNLPERIRAELEVSLGPSEVEEAAREARPLDRRASLRISTLARQLSAALSSLETEGVVEAEFLTAPLVRSLARGPGRPPEVGEFVEDLRVLGRGVVAQEGRSTLLDLATFLERWVRPGEGVLRTAHPAPHGSLTCRLLDPAVIAGPIFAAVHGSIVMSGTLHPGEMFADLLGLETHRRLIAYYPSPFPPSHRLVIAHPTLTTQYDRRSPGMSRAYAEVIAQVASAAPGNVAAFFPSYELLAEAGGALTAAGLPKRLLVERRGMDKGQREGLVAALREANAGAGALLLGVLGGSLSEGVDYEDNLLKVVIVAGLPLTPPSVEAEALRSYLSVRLGRGKGYDYAYVYPAVNRVLQAAGRGIRGEGDRAVVVLLDRRFLDPRYARYFPSDFAPRPTLSPAPSVARFFTAPRVGDGDAPEEGGRGRAPRRGMARAPGGGEEADPQTLPPPRPGWPAPGRKG
jgi:DNA excision repair protein ERCC-2